MGPFADQGTMAFWADQPAASRTARRVPRSNRMGSHPLNLAVRLVLEIAALFSMALWGWSQADGWVRFVLAAVIPMGAAILWGTFAVPDDPSRSGKAPIAVPGIARLAIEAVVFLGGVLAVLDLGYATAGWALGIVAVIHYAISYDRIAWLIRQ